jgi:hypothetical protein
LLPVQEPFYVVPFHECKVANQISFKNRPQDRLILREKASQINRFGAHDRIAGRFGCYAPAAITSGKIYTVSFKVFSSGLDYPVHAGKQKKRVAMELNK